MDEFGWGYISYLFEHFAIGFLLLEVSFSILSFVSTSLCLRLVSIFVDTNVESLLSAGLLLYKFFMLTFFYSLL